MLARTYECGCALPENARACRGIDGSGVIPDSGEHSGHVSIDDGLGQVEGEAGDGSGGVGADAGEDADQFGISRHDAAVMRHDFLSELLKVPGSPIVAESFPGFQNGGLWGGGERGEVGEALKPAGVVAAFQHRRDLGLLEHDFGDENGVGVAGFPPRVVLFRSGEPGDEIGGDAWDARIGGWRFRHEREKR